MLAGRYGEEWAVSVNERQGNQITSSDCLSSGQHGPGQTTWVCQAPKPMLLALFPSQKLSPVVLC